MSNTSLQIHFIVMFIKGCLIASYLARISFVGKYRANDRYSDDVISKQYKVYKYIENELIACLLADLSW